MACFRHSQTSINGYSKVHSLENSSAAIMINWSNPYFMIAPEDKIQANMRYIEATSEFHLPILAGTTSAKQP